MLTQVLSAVTDARGMLTINQLSEQLNVTPSALEGMLDYWVRKGKIERRSYEEVSGSDCNDCTACNDIFSAKQKESQIEVNWQ